VRRRLAVEQVHLELDEVVAALEAAQRVEGAVRELVEDAVHHAAR